MFLLVLLVEHAPVGSAVKVCRGWRAGKQLVWFMATKK